MSSTTSSTDESAYTVFKQDGSHQFYCRWTVEEDMLLSKAVADHGPHRWTLVSRFIPGRTAVQCSTRWFGALNPNVHKGRWSKQEDEALTKAVRYFQSITKTASLPWNRIAENIPNRTGIQCQARFTEALDPAVRKGRWHSDEDKQLGEAIAQYGCCWIRVSSMIPTRTQRQCRTRWNQIHSQQLKAASTSAKGLSRRKSSSISINTITPKQFEFVPSLTIPQHKSPSASIQEEDDNDQFMINNTPSPSFFNTSPSSSPIEIDDVLAIYVSNDDNNTTSSSISSTRSISSSFSLSSFSYSSPPTATSALFPPVPTTKQPHNSLLQHDLFPINNNSINIIYSDEDTFHIGSNSQINDSSNMSNYLFTTTKDFDFLLDYSNLGPQ